MLLRILFVENDPATAELLVPSLERRGYQVSVVRTQSQALGRARTLHPHLLVLDIASLGTNGYKISSAIRARLDGVPTVLFVEKAHAGALADAEEFMTPPFTSRKLLHRLKKLSESVPDREIRIGPLALDPDTRTLCKGDSTYHLRPKEAALLTLFLRNPGKVLSRSEIIKRVWETDYVGDTRTLSVHIRWLRAKIEDDADDPQFLRTVRGVGYRFDVP
ncbi:MAG: response regulator transcription factor [Anaerolineae bacterium]|nr:response regulator transcription factor [Anaerolineae bacterium]